jgi:NAD(P)-dependent dehydrogenase (short-subunit alcohol dehydrogenase family)
MMLQNKIAVIYGAGGAVGGAVARAFARDGANLFLTGRHDLFGRVGSLPCHSHPELRHAH